MYDISLAVAILYSLMSSSVDTIRKLLEEAELTKTSLLGGWLIYTIYVFMCYQQYVISTFKKRIELHNSLHNFS